jgi:hypothetical protein
MTAFRQTPRTAVTAVRQILSRTLLAVSTTMLLSVAVTAHHGQAGLFDEARIVELKGTVKSWSFVNPHPMLVLEVTDDKGGKTDWDVYFGPPGAPIMRRNGYTAETFKKGETLTVKGHPATGAGLRGVDIWGKGVSVTRADGSPVPK